MDDISLIPPVFDKNFSQNELNTELQIISDQAYQWKMCFKMDPNQQVQVYFLNKTNKEGFRSLIFNGSNIDICFSQKHLRLIMDDKLNYDVHVQNNISKCNKIIGVSSCKQTNLAHFYTNSS